jgi:predicted HAD superfamily phosphohydrolase
MVYFFTDWEGPWVTTDFAFEISKRFFNPAFFERLSQYDDYLYFVERKKGYNAGDTLKLMAPFIAASEITSEKLGKLAKEVTSFVPDAERALNLLKEKFRPVIISTSYMQFLRISAEKIGVEEHLHGTEFEVERFSTFFNEEDRIEAESLVREISRLPEIKVDVGKRRLVSGFESVTYLNKIFWGRDGFSKKIRKVFGEVKVVGGSKKLEVLRGYRQRNLVAIGDSISDCEMLGWVRGRGLAVSFNGNEYALSQSDLAIVSNSAFSEAAVVEAYLFHGIEGVKSFVNAANHHAWDKAKKIVDVRIVEGMISSETKYYWIEKEYGEILERSLRMRKALRGDAGKLG